MFLDAALDHLRPPPRARAPGPRLGARQGLEPLKFLVRELELVGLYSMHPPKARGANFRDLVQLSQAFSAIPRVGLLFDYHPDDAEDDPDRRRVVVQR